MDDDAEVLEQYRQELEQGRVPETLTNLPLSERSSSAGQ
jgi:hypothetical protein